MENGLRASIWASKSYGNASLSRHLADWNCPSCGFSNFQWRTECFRCGRAIDGTTDDISDLLPAPLNANHYSALAGRDKRESSQEDSDSLIIDRTGQDFVEPPKRKCGLSASRWAPRNYDGRHKRADDIEIWTRTFIVDNALSTCEENKIPTTSSHPDLGLPYEVQHYILTMIQRIIEEGCYDFASRWMPDALHKNNWTCPEAVELSTWKKFLPTALPPDAVVPVPNRSLEDALGDAVRIRNAAVHRHLCDNIEIRRMASQAQDLMLIFSDVTKQNKFIRLEAELHDWDAGIQDDQEEKKRKLQAALLEISERPLDDMDWTPNAVSLQEIKSHEEEYMESQDYYADEMELD